MDTARLIGLADNPALDFLNTTGISAGAAVELLGSGPGYLAWLQSEALISAGDGEVIAGRFGAAELDAAAAEARVLREWLRPVVAAWASGTAAVTAQVRARLNPVLAAGGSTRSSKTPAAVFPSWPSASGGTPPGSCSYRPPRPPRSSWRASTRAWSAAVKAARAPCGSTTGPGRAAAAGAPWPSAATARKTAGTGHGKTPAPRASRRRAEKKEVRASGLPQRPWRPAACPAGAARLRARRRQPAGRPRGRRSGRAARPLPAVG